MVSPLYSLAAISFALVLLIILLHDRRNSSEVEPVERAYWLLIKWVIFFCLQDTVWGICASDLVTDNLPLFISSTVFHLSTVTTTYFWLSFIVVYLGERLKYRRLLLGFGMFIVALQVGLLTVNLFRPIIFHVIGGRYYTDTLRTMAFMDQYVIYLAISIITGIVALSKRGRRREGYTAVFIFSLAPVLSGVCQYLYPDGPFYSMGYFFGCFIIHIFVVSHDREELLKLQSQRQTRLANTDELSSLHNRHAYEKDINTHQATAENVNLTYFAIDINGMKMVNDTIGHKAGDELIRATADCMRICLGSYGKLYRIGGDEFAAIIYATEEELAVLKQDLEERVLQWHGELVDNLSLAIGIVTRREFPDTAISELAILADNRMYEDKQSYYKIKGIDRNGQHLAYMALCASYNKILKINLTTDSYNIIQMDDSEQTQERGFNPTSIFQWLRSFGISGEIHADDVQQYLAAVDPDAIKGFFLKGNSNLNIFYRRKTGNSFRLNKMEMIPAEDYSNLNISLYLYVKDIDR